jgi:IS5 family transposase
MHRNWPRAIARVTERIGRTPTAVTADRGYGYAAVEADLHEVGVRTVAIPRASKPGAKRREFEHRKAFRAKIKWRTGCEGRINQLSTHSLRFRKRGSSVARLCAQLLGPVVGGASSSG